MKVRLKDVRLAFPAIFEPESFDGSGKDAKYRAVLLIPKKSPLVAELKAAFDEVAKEKWGAKSQAVLKELFDAQRMCMRDGDKKTDWDGFEGHMFVSASGDARPLVIDRNKAPLTKDDGRPYAGCYVNCNVVIWAQENKYGKRINAQLGGIQFVRDGDAFSGGRASTEEEFDDLSEGSDADDVI